MHTSFLQLTSDGIYFDIFIKVDTQVLFFSSIPLFKLLKIKLY